MERPPRHERLRDVSVLIVDDEPDVAATLAAILDDEGATTTTAGSAAAALALFARTLPDVVLSDLKMENESGFRLLARIRAHEDPRIANVPVIAVTGALEYQAALYEVPFTARMLKPVDADVLVSLVEQISRARHR